ncbi:MAG: hypothetical protein GY792_26545 [Gammaproteobacteria bacterium]|nr:hypothetical protein [Gammaproteobacteria bacterium]
MIALNALPIYGVLSWGWQSFDLIFLYWLENLIIGALNILRMLVRPYRHGLDFAMPLFFAPFFTLHYGMFCLVHGVFVFSLFGQDRFDSQGLTDVLQHIWPVLQGNHLLWAAICLLLLQVFDWLRDITKNGPGFDNVKALMMAPYRRIVVLHITLIVSGFALAALDEPVVGLMILILLKTAFDIYHWKKDDAVDADDKADALTLTPEKLRQMQEQFAKPEIEVNGNKLRFDSFQEMKDSKHFKMLSSIMRMFGRSKEYRFIETFIDMKIAEENDESPVVHAQE